MGSGWARTVFMGMDRRRFLGRGGILLDDFLVVIGIVIIIIVIIVITVEERCGVGVVSEGVHHHPSFFPQNRTVKQLKCISLYKSL